MKALFQRLKAKGKPGKVALVAVYRHINDNIKMGVGYNFTDFSDDLTHLNYDRRGFFVNALAKY